jgi:hypothetical protein
LRLDSLISPLIKKGQSLHPYALAMQMKLC